MVGYGEYRGIQGRKSPNIRFINKKDKGHSVRNEKENRTQRKLGTTSISEVKLPLKSRDELPPILRALQHIYATPELIEEVCRIVEEKVMRGKKKTWRYGMELWHIIGIGGSKIGVKRGL